MKINEINFVEHFEKNLKGKGFVSIDKITESYFIYHGKQYTGPTCTNCLNGTGQDLKELYKKLKPIYDDFMKIEDLTLEQQILLLETEYNLCTIPFQKGLLRKKINKLKNVY